YLSSKQSVSLAVCCIIISLLLGAFFIDKSIAVFVISLMLFSSSYGLLYAPIMHTGIKSVPEEKKGVAMGFYNLVVFGIAISSGFIYSSFLIDKKDLQFSF
ncbi:MFS transporter, partial [Bacillus cereus]|uniref:MFS transporter n=1 Tax=Bacillus cereus TaxID=1396 RepID=UPI0011560329